ncbi:hypothetical protein CYMTET_33428, partial [Cymbomonas tetramitiformis]
DLCEAAYEVALAPRLEPQEVLIKMFTEDEVKRTGVVTGRTSLSNFVDVWNKKLGLQFREKELSVKLTEAEAAGIFCKYGFDRSSLMPYGAGR